MFRKRFKTASIHPGITGHLQSFFMWLRQHGRFHRVMDARDVFLESYIVFIFYWGRIVQVFVSIFHALQYFSLKGYMIVLIPANESQGKKMKILHLFDLKFLTYSQLLRLLHGLGLNWSYKRPNECILGPAICVGVPYPKWETHPIDAVRWCLYISQDAEYLIGRQLSASIVIHQIDKHYSN